MVAFISTGVPGLDIALGGAGLPGGRLTEIYGLEKCGKTALSLLAVSEAQQLGGTAAFIDINQALDPARAAQLGVDAAGLIYARPESARQAMEIAGTLTRSGALTLVVVDSLAGLLTQERRDLQNTRSGTASRELSQFVRAMAVLAEETGTAVLFTNDKRAWTTRRHGAPETTPGGIALKLHAAVRLEMTPGEQIRSGFEIVGDRVQVVKPKSTASFHTTIINFMYNGEVSRLDDLFDLAVELKVLNKRGSSYSSSKSFLGRGREAAIASLNEHPQLAGELEAEIRKHFLPSSTIPADEGCT